MNFSTSVASLRSASTGQGDRLGAERVIAFLRTERSTTPEYAHRELPTPAWHELTPRGLDQVLQLRAISHVIAPTKAEGQAEVVDLEHLVRPAV